MGEGRGISLSVPFCSRESPGFLLDVSLSFPFRFSSPRARRLPLP